MTADNLGDRMKGYENIERKFLYRRTPVIMRLDGKAFHTFTKGCKKPFDNTIIKTMQDTTEFLMKNIQGAKIGYVQSDEISILITDYDSLETDAWYGYNVQKMCSVSASMASVNFTLAYHDKVHDGLNIDDYKYPSVKMAYFDSRVNNYPKEEVINYFRWRYQDWVRNSIQMLAQSNYSQKELNGISCKKLITKMETEKEIFWDRLDPVYKNGTLFCYTKATPVHLFPSPKEETILVKLSNINLNSNEQCEIIFKEYI